MAPDSTWDQLIIKPHVWECSPNAHWLPADWGCNQCPGELLPVPYHPLVNNFLLILNLTFPWSNSMPFSWALSPHQRVELCPSAAPLILLWGAEGFVTLIRSLIVLCSSYVVDPKPVPIAWGGTASAQQFNWSGVQQLMNHFRRSQAQDSFWFCITDITY